MSIALLLGAICLVLDVLVAGFSKAIADAVWEALPGSLGLHARYAVSAYSPQILIVVLCGLLSALAAGVPRAIGAPGFQRRFHAVVCGLAAGGVMVSLAQLLLYGHYSGTFRLGIDFVPLGVLALFSGTAVAASYEVLFRRRRPA